MKYLVGIQPTGKIHIGNYLGCLKRGLELQEQGHEVIFMIANYHSLTTDSYTEETEKELKRLGCKNIIHQTPEYTELFFEICCQLNLGRLKKLPQFQQKKDEVKFNLGILLYPALMAADIIINDPDVVLVGKDQVTHIHLCNDVSKRRGGRRYQYELGQSDVIKSLRDSEKKMSKSLGEEHVLYLFDEDYDLKVRKAVADEEGIKNLKIIAEGLGVDPNNYQMNSELKAAISESMKKKFI